MAENLAFVRKASGLVRGLSLYDAFGIAVSTTLPIWGIWFTIMIGLGLYSGANLILTVLISGVLVGISAPFVWGILAGSMPRSGGEYIYNSRVLSPVIAVAASFAQVVAVVFWSFIQTVWISQPSLQMMAAYFGWKGVENFVVSDWGVFTLSVITNILVLLVLVFGMNVYKRVQKFTTVILIGGPVFLAIILTLASKSSFIGQWNALATQYHSLDYHGFIAAVGKASGAAMPTTWNWADTFGAMSGAFALFIYTYTIGYVGGEVKRPGKSIMYANWLSIWIPVVIAIWTFAAIYRLVDFNFFSASAWAELNGAPKGYTFPFSPSYFTITWIAGGTGWPAGLVAGCTFLVAAFMGTAINLLVLTRATFAWGMDRMGPSWFASIHPRWASPVKLYVFFTIIVIAGTFVYQVSKPASISGLIAGGMQFVSVFLITGISAALFAYRRKARGIWEASPYRGWKLFGIPVITLAAIVYLGYVGILLYFSFLGPKTRDANAKNLIVFAVVWAIGIAWYYGWRWQTRRRGVDPSVIYNQLPPE